jgi:hypothetical protein
MTHIVKNPQNSRAQRINRATPASTGKIRNLDAYLGTR